MKKNILATCFIFASITIKQSFCQDCNESKNIKIPVVSDIIVIKDGMTTEINNIAKIINGEIIEKFSQITSGKDNLEKTLSNLVAFIALLKIKFPQVFSLADNCIEQVGTIDKINILRIAGNITKIGPKIRAFLDNTLKSIKNLQDASSYIINDLEVPVKEAYDLICKINATGLFELTQNNSKSSDL
jgi:hypothetical protein